MARFSREIYTNFSKGEVSPKVEGRPDIVAFKEGTAVSENMLLLKQAGETRRPGLRFIAEVKDSDKGTILIPFEAGLSSVFMIEVGSEYMRFYKDKTQLEASPGIPVEIVTPYNDTNLRAIHFTQSVDVLFLFQAKFRQRRLNRIGDLQWALIDIVHRPPPSFEKDTDISDTTLTIDPGQGITGPGTGLPGDGGVYGGGDSGTNGGDGGSGGGDGGDGGGGDGSE